MKIKCLSYDLKNYISQHHLQASLFWPMRLRWSLWAPGPSVFLLHYLWLLSWEGWQDGKPDESGDMVELPQQLRLPTSGLFFFFFPTKVKETCHCLDLGCEFLFLVDGRHVLWSSSLLYSLSTVLRLQVHLEREDQQLLSLIPSSDLWSWVRGLTGGLPRPESDSIGRVSPVSCPASSGLPRRFGKRVTLSFPRCQPHPKSSHLLSSVWS